MTKSTPTPKRPPRYPVPCHSPAVDMVDRAPCASLQSIHSALFPATHEATSGRYSRAGAAAAGYVLSGPVQVGPQQFVWVRGPRTLTERDQLLLDVLMTMSYEMRLGSEISYRYGYLARAGYLAKALFGHERYITRMYDQLLELRDMSMHYTSTAAFKRASFESIVTAVHRLGEPGVLSRKRSELEPAMRAVGLDIARLPPVGAVLIEFSREFIERIRSVRNLTLSHETLMHLIALDCPVRRSIARWCLTEKFVPGADLDQVLDRLRVPTGGTRVRMIGRLKTDQTARLFEPLGISIRPVQKRGGALGVFYQRPATGALAITRGPEGSLFKPTLPLLPVLKEFLAPGTDEALEDVESRAAIA